MDKVKVRKLKAKIGKVVSSFNQDNYVKYADLSASSFGNSFFRIWMENKHPLPRSKASHMYGASIGTCIHACLEHIPAAAEDFDVVEETFTKQYKGLTVGGTVDFIVDGHVGDYKTKYEHVYKSLTQKVDWKPSSNEVWQLSLNAWLAKANDETGFIVYLPRDLSAGTLRAVDNRMYVIHEVQLKSHKEVEERLEQIVTMLKNEEAPMQDCRKDECIYCDANCIYNKRRLQ
jgi:hypothetical protein